MTDKLVERARAIDPLDSMQCCVNSPLYGDMADRIEELEAENARLRCALDRIQDGSYGKNAAIARTALKGEPKE